MTQDQYTVSSKLYDTCIGPFSRGLRRIALATAPPADGMGVLEVGCGTGENLRLYQEAGCRVAGLDLSPSMLEVARAKLGAGTDLRLGDATRMPYGDGEFDLSLCMLMLHEVAPAVREGVVAEMARVVGPEGRLLLVDFHPGPFAFPRGWLHRSTIWCFERLAGGDHYKNYKQFMATGGLPQVLAGLGLRMERERIVGGGSMGLYLLRGSAG